ncbi:MAG: F0F1 ATP synthase subunit alpha [Candidatus Roizmanbacteria bacterium]
MSILDQYIKDIEKELTSRTSIISPQDTGKVVFVTDGVVRLTGLDDITYGEMIEFSSGGQAMVIDLLQDEVGAIVLGDYLHIKSGDTARATGKVASVPVADELLGRVVDALGHPLDSKEKIKTTQFNPIEKIAHGVVSRKSVSVPLQTGIKSIDALIPVGRGQRELIIGDRGTGKTTLVLDIIRNQKKENVICVYCAIGQRNSKIASAVEYLRAHDALDYTVIVSASASDPASMQYLAPYSATAMAEYFLEKGKDVVVIYDDLSKHAYAYRQVSLILRRPAGREAYPGDVFYLHSRLLERACRLNEKYGGGSITALPIIETLSGDVSAYIPTNVISITDGQIFLDADLFNSGLKPAINVGISVSRVGGSAQTKAMKQVSGRLKLDLAQYRSMEAFSQFESELDEETKKQLNRGARVTQILKQNKGDVYDLASQVAIIWASTNGYLDVLKLIDVEEFEKKCISQLHVRMPEWIAKLNSEKVLSKEMEEELKKFIEQQIQLTQ